MNKMSLPQIRQTELEILKFFRDFCEENNISYCLSNGTLLGAVKYRGFIPWDDDVDVLVPRRDYDRLITIFQDTERYHLYARERERKYRFPFAKLCDMTTRKVERNVENGIPLGLDIDIFPLDAWPDRRDAAEKRAERIYRNIRRLMFLKCQKADSANPVKRGLKDCALKLLSPCVPMILDNIRRLALSGPAVSCPAFVGDAVWCIYRRREIIPAEVFRHFVPVEFEGEVFMAPAGYDDYLKSLYGDYHEDPPADQQKTHHLFDAYLVR